MTDFLAPPLALRRFARLARLATRPFERLASLGLVALGRRSATHHRLAGLRGLGAFRLSGQPFASPRAGGSRLRWKAASSPGEVFKTMEPPLPQVPPGPGAPRRDPFLDLIRRLSRSVDSSFWTSQHLSRLDPALAGSNPIAPMAAVDLLMEQTPWEIGVDEPLDASHPCVAIAYFERLAWEEARIFEAHAGEPTPEAMEALGRLLALAMMGDPQALNGLDAFLLDGFERSLFARTRMPRALATARLLLPSLRERKALGEELAIAQRSARDGARL